MIWVIIFSQNSILKKKNGCKMTDLWCSVLQKFYFSANGTEVTNAKRTWRKPVGKEHRLKSYLSKAWNFTVMSRKGKWYPHCYWNTPCKLRLIPVELEAMKHSNTYTLWEWTAYPATYIISQAMQRCYKQPSVHRWLQVPERMGWVSETLWRGFLGPCWVFSLVFI